MTETEHGVTVERRGALALWTLNRPDRMNALSRATVRRLGQLAREARTDATIRAVILTGAGDRAFCAGADLKERQGMSEEDVRDFLGLYRAAFDAIDRLPKPVIAAIDGVAFGGGLELALACDLRVMRAGTQIGLTEVSLAIIPGAGGTQRLTRIVGPAKAKELILLARRIDAAEALSLGVVNRVAEGESALDAALALAAPFEHAAPIAVAAALDAIDAASDLPLDAGLLVERRCYERTLESEDRLEALAAFRDKRPPVYRGR
ncbi:MAG: enoyl-CoA hydratase/isomerase family protein [Myxococcales bacterium]|nr:enoyl-CoA hydratase/isomerase family protein [Myxococcales bacterium]